MRFLLRVTARGRARHLLAAAAVLLACSSQPASAWTPAARARMTRDAVKLMPATLRQLLERYQRDLAAGLLHPGTGEDAPDHWQHPDGRYGRAASQAEKEARAIIAAMDSHEPLAKVARRFGVLAHRIGDINDPLHAADRHPALGLYYADYQGYVESQLDRFRLVFHGYRSPLLTRDGPGAFLMESARRSHEYAAAVRRAYDDEGVRVSPQKFDVRSLAFGVGSLAYSHAVNDIVRVWMWAWEGCHGDVSDTPLPLAPVPGDERVARRESTP